MVRHYTNNSDQSVRYNLNEAIKDIEKRFGKNRIEEVSSALQNEMTRLRHATDYQTLRLLLNDMTSLKEQSLLLGEKYSFSNTYMRTMLIGQMSHEEFKTLQSLIHTSKRLKKCPFEKLKIYILDIIRDKEQHQNIVSNTKETVMQTVNQIV